MPTTDNGLIDKITEAYINEDVKEIILIPQGLSAETPDFHFLGNFSHGPANDGDGPVIDHVIWHHVRDLLYHAKEYNPALYAISEIKDGVPVRPPVIGPTEILVKTSGGFNDLTKNFTLESPDCHVVLIARCKGDPIVEIRHGGELLTRTSYDYGAPPNAVDGRTTIMYFVGRGLTLENAPLTVKVLNAGANNSVDQGFLRINAMKNIAPELTYGRTVSVGNPGPRSILTMQTDVKPYRMKAASCVIGDPGFAQGLTMSSEANIERRAYGRIITASPVPNSGIESPKGGGITLWRYNGGVGSDATSVFADNPVSDGRRNATFMFQATGHLEYKNPVVRAHLSIEDGSSVLVGRYSAESLGYIGETIYGPFDDDVEVIIYAGPANHITFGFTGKASASNMSLHKDGEPFYYCYYDGGLVNTGEPERTLRLQPSYFETQGHLLLGAGMYLAGDNFSDMS